MRSMMTLLDPLRLPLRGSHLIEASAGTGKTWTIAALYLRLVLGPTLTDDAAFTRALLPSEILVLTFTRAATQELVSRIRQRLLQAAQVFRGEIAAGDDPFLSALRQAHADRAQAQRAAHRLSLAAQSMDNAAIYTIDAWCQRVLREHALQGVHLFTQTLLADERALLKDAVQDYWRVQLYSLSPALLEVALAVWPDWPSLLAQVTEFLKYRRYWPPGSMAQASLASVIEQTQSQQQAALVQLKALWAPRVASMSAWLQAQFDAPQGPFNKKVFAPHRAQLWLSTLTQWVQTPTQLTLAWTDKAWERLRPAGLRAAFKPEAQVDIAPCFEQLSELREHLNTLQDGGVGALRWHAARQVLARLSELKQQTHTVSFDDLQSQLESALHGPHAQALRASLLVHYPVALIDEFQDTSGVQLRIFEALYRLQNHDQNHAVFLIGDPKQSIYEFRGADIHSYLQAKQATQGRQHMLGTNHRSASALVHSVNALFVRADARPGPGAFLFRTTMDDPLPFVPVAAQGRREQLEQDARVLPAITWCVAAQAGPKTKSLAQLAQCAALRIRVLLNDPSCGFRQDKGVWARLRAADMAVLVRDRTQAQAMQAALRRLGVAAVFLSDQRSVFASIQARDLVHWLQALARPHEPTLVRAALATTTLARSLDELKALARRPEILADYTAMFVKLHALWERAGVLAMLRQGIHTLGLPSRWHGQPQAERCLTNLLHLAELLQTQSQFVGQHHALITWLTQQIAHPSSEQKAQIVRLESDADLVKIVTVHQSKGLEYPLVFLPFAALTKTRHRTPLLWLSEPDAQGQRYLLERNTPQELAQISRNRLREDLRLLYVALTRAQHALWVGVGIDQAAKAAHSQFHTSALGYLLTGSEPVQVADIHQALADLAQTAPGMQIRLDDEDQAFVHLSADVSTPPATSALIYEGQIDRRWRIHSYSGLVKGLSNPSHPGEQTVLDLNAIGQPAAPAPSTSPWHTFPKGPVAGNFLHDQLQRLAQERFTLGSLQRQRLSRQCVLAGFEAQTNDVLAWLSQIATVILPPLGASLSQLDQVLPEMEFWLPISTLASAQKIDTLCHRYLLNQHPRATLAPQQLHGLLMGFADMVLAWQGRYWVLDYKSNVLGPHDDHYHPRALEAAMAEHRYDVQALLYTRALHGLLQNRLGDAYDPRAHLGGAIYFFLRGIAHPQRGCYVVPADIRWL